KVGEELQHPVGRWDICDRVRGIDQRFAPETVAGRAQDFGCDAAFDRQHHELPEHCRLREAADAGPGILALPVLELREIARSQHELVTMPEETRAQSASHLSGSENSNLHERPLTRFPRAPR